MIRFTQLQDGELVEIGIIENGEITEDTDGLVERYTQPYDLNDEEELFESFDGPQVFAAVED